MNSKQAVFKWFMMQSDVGFELDYNDKTNYKRYTWVYNTMQL